MRIAIIGLGYVGLPLAAALRSTTTEIILAGRRMNDAMGAFIADQIARA